jgi:Bifunctional DNA primase/polymerase, N-terminal
MKPRDDPGGYFKFYGERLVANGYSVVAVKPGTKQPRHRRWTTACFKLTDPVFLLKHSYNFPDDSVAIACGTRVLVIDIDADDPELADRIHQIACETLGDTPLVRVGKHPRRALLYRPVDRINTTRHGKFEIIGIVGKIMAYGRHPGTRMPYKGWEQVRSTLRSNGCCR